MNHSLLYPYAVFLHVVGVMGFMIFYGLEWATLQRLQREPNPNQLAATLAPLGMGRRLISISGPMLLFSGIYLVWAAWAIQTAWILTGIAAMILLGYLGGKVTGKHVRALMSSKGKDLSARLPSMWASFTTRISVLVATIFVMCTKPGPMGSIAALLLALVVGRLLARKRAEPSMSGASMGG